MSSLKRLENLISLHIKATLMALELTIRKAEQDVEHAKEVLRDLRARLEEVERDPDLQSTAPSSHDDDVSVETVRVTRKRSRPSSRNTPEVIVLDDDDDKEEEARSSKRQKTKTGYKHTWRRSPEEIIRSRIEGISSRKQVEDALGDIFSSLNRCEAEAVAYALLATHGVLSPTDFLTFFSLSSKTDDPVELARTTYKTEPAPLFCQLMGFSHYLSKGVNELRDDYGYFQMNRNFDRKLNRLIRAFRRQLLGE